ncbi:MAG: alpha/beta hydrolase family protein [Flammeovirgaceae bacterium]
MNRSIIFFFLLLSITACKEDHTSIKGIWVGTANVEPFPEFIKLNYDSIPHIRLYFNEVSQETIIDFDGKNASFSVDEGMLGLYEGQLDNDTLKGSFLLDRKKNYDCNLIRVSPNSLGEVSQLIGFYHVAPNRVIEVLPYPIDADLVALRILDHMTGKQRVAFPMAPNRYVAGPSMLNPFPQELSFTVVGSDNNQVPGIEYRDGSESYRAKRMEDIANYEDFKVKNGEVELSCTITFPSGDGPFPLVVHVPRAGEITQADAFDNHLRLLPWNNVAVLRYDKRGTGESTGNLETAAFDDLANDLLAIIKHAKQNPKIVSDKIGVSGLDYASKSMFIAAAKSKEIKFVISLGSSALNMEESELLACAQRMEMDGFDAQQVNEALNYQKSMFKYFRGEIDSLAFQTLSDEAKQQKWNTYVTLFDNKKYINQWRIRHHYDPIPYLKKIEVPLLLAYGENDLIAPPKYNFPVIKKVFENSKTPHNQLIVYPNANHQFILGETRGDFQFTEIKGYAPGFFQKVHSWILERFELKNTL